MNIIYDALWLYFCGMYIRSLVIRSNHNKTGGIRLVPGTTLQNLGVPFPGMVILLIIMNLALDSGGYDIHRGLFLLAMVCIIATGMNRIKIAENGILTATGFLPWHRIVSFEWIGPNKLYLNVSGHPLLKRFINPGKVSIKPEHRDQVDALMQEHSGADRPGE